MNTRHVLVLAGCLAAGFLHAATSSCQVAYYNFGGVADGERIPTMIASIDASPGFSARPADRTGDGWRAVPEGVAPEQWLSLVKVKFGNQCDFLLFRFADRNGTVAYAGRRPSRVRDVKYYFSVPPGPDQIPENAVRETATDFVFRSSNETAVSRSPIRIRVEGWAVAANEMAESSGASLRPEVLEAMAFAAAYEAGWQPTAGEAPVTVGVSGREEMGLFIAVCGRKPNQELAFFRKNIPRESLYNYLVRLFFKMRLPEAVLDSAAYGSPAASLAAWKDGRAILAGGEEGLRAYDLATGRSSGSISNEITSAVSGALRVEEDRIVYSVKTPGPGSGGPATWRFDAGEVLLAPPEERDGRVLVLAKNNVITLLDAASGKVVASRTWPTWLLGGCLLPGKAGPRVAVVDLRRRVTFLEGRDLAAAGEVALPWDLKGPLLYAEGVPPAWPLQASEEPEGLVPEIANTAGAAGALLVRDRDGFLHGLRTPTGSQP